ncbi:MAG: hypothetical protein V7603_1965 [Micromonosporaceae bacterium]
MPGTDGRPLPPLVWRALAAAESEDFGDSSRPSVGRLLAALAASKPKGRLGESGTGLGAGTAWLVSGMSVGGVLVTVERDRQRAAQARELFSGDERVTVLTGQWTELRAHAPFDVLFCDGGGKQEGPDGLIGLLAPAGILVLDDFAPADSWPPRYRDSADELRLRYLTHPALSAVELQVEPDMAVVLAVRR